MGIFVGLEGIDASGKTTVSSMLVDELKRRNIKVKLIEKKFTDYTDDRINKHTKVIKDLIWGNKTNDPYHFVTDQGWLFKHALWYSILAENHVKPSLDEYDILVVDGWFYKIYSRFLLKDNFNSDLLDTISNSLYDCDKVFMLDAEPSSCWSRREHFRSTEMGGYDFKVKDPRESYITYQGKVRKQLKDIGEKKAWTLIDTKDHSALETTNIIADSISLLLNNEE